MIQKFQLGGQQDAMIQFVQGLALILLADPQQIVLAAQQNPKALEAAVQTYLLTQDMNLAAQVFTQAILQQVQTARHGAKLQYLRSLKNQCPEGEELYYYKKGGSVGCGCKKKEDGSEIKKALNGAVAKFKNRTKAQLDKINKLSEEDYFNGTADHTKPGTPQKPVLKFKTRSKAELERINKLSEKDYFVGTADHTKPGVKKVSKKACGSKIKKECNGAVAKFKAACGSKIKKNQLGGSLNGVPFYLGGTSKGGLPIAPKAEDRYKRGTKEITIVHPYDVTKFGFRGTQPIRKVNSGSASISEIIRDAKDGTPADTMYYEIPNHLPFVNVQPRYSFSYGNLSSKYGFNPEFNILKRRFNTAWNLAK